MRKAMTKKTRSCDKETLGESRAPPVDPRGSISFDFHLPHMFSQPLLRCAVTAGETICCRETSDINIDS